mgnify:CR=1 FL=1
MKKPYGTAIEVPDIVNDMTVIVIEVGPCPCVIQNQMKSISFLRFSITLNTIGHTE